MVIVDLNKINIIINKQMHYLFSIKLVAYIGSKFIFEYLRINIPCNYT